MNAGAEVVVGDNTLLLRFGEWRRRWFHVGAFFLMGFWILLFMIAIAIGGAVFDNMLFAGPDLVVAVPSTDPDVQGIVSVTPTNLDSAGLRIGWAVGSSAIVLGIAIALLTIGQAAVSEGERPIFGSKAAGFITVRSVAVMTLLLAGGLTRFGLEGRVAEAAGVDVISGHDDGFDLWVFDIPFLAVIFATQFVAGLWSRATTLQVQTEDIV